MPNQGFTNSLIVEVEGTPLRPELAVALSNLAGLYKDQGRMAEAQLCTKRAVAIREKAGSKPI